MNLAQWAIGNSPSGLLSENVIKIMKNKEKILMFLEKFIKILDASNKLIFSLFFIILMTFSDKSLDGLLQPIFPGVRP